MSASALARDIARQREQQCWQLRAEFKTQNEIATILGIDQTTVSKILRKVNTQASEALIVQASQTKLLQVAQLEYVAMEAMRAWERSKEASKKSSIKTKTIGKSANGRKIEDRGVSTENREGDAKYLHAAMKALSDIREILGINAPLKLSIGLELVERFVTVTQQMGVDPENALNDYVEALISEYASDSPTDSPE